MSWGQVLPSRHSPVPGSDQALQTCVGKFPPSFLLLQLMMDVFAINQLLKVDPWIRRLFLEYLLKDSPQFLPLFIFPEEEVKLDCSVHGENVTSFVLSFTLSFIFPYLPLHKPTTWTRTCPLSSTLKKWWSRLLSTCFFSLCLWRIYTFLLFALVNKQ